MTYTNGVVQNGTKKEICELSDLVDPTEIIDPSSSEYAANSATWSTAKNKHPHLVLRPKSVESLSRMVTFLSQTDLEYSVRSGGCGSASAADVLISLSAFDDFEFNEKDEYVLLGSGTNWRNHYTRMQEAAPGWSIVACRTPCLGIGGSTLCSGFSWLSSEYGCVSDPANLIDVRVVMADGQVKWASEDPELFWAMRGTETGFAIATHFKFRARRSPENGKIWGGPIIIPQEGIAAAADGVMGMVQADIEGNLSNKVSLFLYLLHAKQVAFVGLDDPQDMMLIHAYDGRGEEEGRKMFKWALDIKGAIDMTRGDLTPLDMARMQEGGDQFLGKDEVYWSPIAMTNDGEHKLTKEIIIESYNWWETMNEEKNSIAEAGWMILELFSCRDSLTGQESSAWPRPKGYKHMVLLGAGCAANSSKELSDKARDYIINGPKQIMGKSTQELDIVAHCIEDFHSVEKLYGTHYEKLRQIKTRVDPHNRIPGRILPYSGTAVVGKA